MGNSEINYILKGIQSEYIRTIRHDGCEASTQINGYPVKKTKSICGKSIKLNPCILNK